MSPPGILIAQVPSSCELGQAIIFELDERAQRLDHFLAENRAQLDVGRWLQIFAQAADANVREMSDDQLETRGSDWKIIVDYPFDRAGHNLNEDVERLSQFRSVAVVAENPTICWLPGFLNHEAQKAIGTLVRLEHILGENRFRTFVAHLSDQNQAAACPLLESQRDQLKGQLCVQIEALYGLREPQTQFADPVNQLSGADHLQLLCQLTPRPPVAANLRDALNGILTQALEYQFPAASSFEEETRFTKTNVAKVLEVIEQALASTDPSVVVSRIEAQ